MELLNLLQSQHPWFFYSMLSLLLLSVGSLLNVIIYRLPIMLIEEWKQECRMLLEEKPSLAIASQKSFNLFFPRSSCPQCSNTIAFWQNIPLISYLFLRGKCYYCKSKISLQYPLIEFLSLALGLFSLWHFGLGLQFFASLLFIWISLSLIMIDIKNQLLPDSLTLALLWLGLIFNCYDTFTALNNAVLSAAGAWLFLWCFIRLFYLITGKIGMGNGDFKLFAAFGAWFGWTQLPFILILASLSGAVIGLIYLNITKQDKGTTPVPFGPFLCFAAMISLFWGEAFVSWYSNLLTGTYSLQ